METGVIKKWENNSGWGFIAGDDGEDYFFNICNVRQGQKMRVGLNVKFDPSEGQKGSEAENISIV